MLNLTRQQQGSVLLEALIAILIFSMGILAIVGLQATAIRSVADSQYRLEASFLANRIVADMWADVTNVPNFAYPGGSAPALTAWADDVTALLPGAAGAPPTIEIAGDATNGYTVTVTLFWQAPGDSSRHNLTTMAYINANS